MAPPQSKKGAERRAARDAANAGNSDGRSIVSSDGQSMSRDQYASRSRDNDPRAIVPYGSNQRQQWEEPAKKASHGSTPYWEDVYKRSLPTMKSPARVASADDVVGYLEFVEVTDISPSVDWKQVLITVEPLEQPGQFDTTCGPFNLELMKSVVFQRAKCHDAQVQLEPSLSAMKGYVQVLRVRIRVHYCPREVTSEQQLHFIGATDPIEISWHPVRSLYTLRGLDGNPVGQIYFANRLMHRSDLQRPVGEKAILGSLNWPSAQGLVPLDVYSFRYLDDMKQMYPTTLRSHADLLKRVITQHRLDPLPREDDELLKWVLKVQGNVLFPFLHDEEQHELVIQVISSNMQSPAHSSITDMVGGAGSKVKVIIENPDQRSEHHWNKSTDVSPFRQGQDVSWKTKFLAQARVLKDKIKFELYETHPGTGDTLDGYGTLEHKEYHRGYDGNVKIRAKDGKGASYLLRVKVSIGKSLAHAVLEEQRVWQGSFLEPERECYSQQPDPYSQQSYAQSGYPQRSLAQPGGNSYGGRGSGYAPSGNRQVGVVTDRRSMGLSEIETVSRGGNSRGGPSMYDGRQPSMYDGRQPSMYDGRQPSMNAQSSMYDGRQRSMNAQPSMYDGRQPSMSAQPTTYDGRQLSSMNVGRDQVFDSRRTEQVFDSRRTGANDYGEPSMPMQSMQSQRQPQRDMQSMRQGDAFEQNYDSRDSYPRDSRDPYSNSRDTNPDSRGKRGPTFSREDIEGHEECTPRGTPIPRAQSWVGSAMGAVEGVMRSMSHHSRFDSQDNSRDNVTSPGNVGDQAPSRYANENAGNFEEDDGPPGPALQVFLICADHLQIADFMGKSDPYVKVELRGQNGVTKGKIKETNYKYQTLEPAWDEMLEFKNYELGDELHLEVWDKDFIPFSTDDLLGRAHINANDVALGFDDFIMLTEAGATEGQARMKVRVVPPHNNNY